MDILIVLILISLALLVGAIVLLLRSIGAGDYEHADRLSLLPLEGDDDTRARDPRAQRLRPATEGKGAGE